MVFIFAKFLPLILVILNVSKSSAQFNESNGNYLKKTFIHQNAFK